MSVMELLSVDFLLKIANIWMSEDKNILQGHADLFPGTRQFLRWSQNNLLI